MDITTTHTTPPPTRRRAGVRASVRRSRRSLAWAGYAACGWAIAYAVGVRGYQGLGGTVGLSGTFSDPAGMRQASLTAGAFLLLVGIGALGLVRPWGLRLPRWLVLVPAIAGSSFAMAHALTAYITKPLHALDIVHLQFEGWAQRNETSQFLWDLLFYEPWFLLLGILVTLASVHHFRRTGGSAAGSWRLLALTTLATVLLTAWACALVISRSA
jgi:hypothetical protein